MTRGRPREAPSAAADMDKNRAVTMWSGVYRFLSASRANSPVSGARMNLLSRLFCDESGSQIILVTLLIPAILGLGALATDGANLAYTHLNLQAAADTAALSAKKLAINNHSANTSLEAEFVAARYGVVSGVGGATVVAFAPQVTPSGTAYSGCTLSATAVSAINTNYPQAIEVIVSQPPVQTVSQYFGLMTNNICALAVAAPNPNGGSCMLALGTTGVDFDIEGNNTTINTSSCGLYSNSKSTNSIKVGGNNDAFTGPVATAGGISGSTSDFSPAPLTGVQPAIDPYATTSSAWPSTCSGTCTARTCSPCSTSLSPGVYANGITLGSNNTIYTLSAGIYYLGPQGMTIGGNGVTVNATGGVTLVFDSTSGTGSSGITVGNSNNFTLNLVAPSNASQWNDGVAIWQPLPTQFTPTAAAPTNGISFTKNNPVLNVTGLIYTPDASVNYAMNNGQSTCTQIIAKSFSFTKNNTVIGFANGVACNGVAGAPTGAPNQFAVLVE
jgi:hypothetical protein